MKNQEINYIPVKKHRQPIINKPNTREILKRWDDLIEYNASYPMLAANPIPMFIVMWHILVLWPLYFLFYPFSK